MDHDALASLNLGIEIGQIAIVALTLAGLWFLTRLSVRAVQPVRAAALAAIGLVTAFWTVERTLVIV